MIILCADDYGLAEGVSQAILEFGAECRLSATSAMTTFAHWPRDATRLGAIRDRVAIGLHLNLTLGRPLRDAAAAGHVDAAGAFLPVASLIRRAVLGRLDVGALARECAAQIESFRAATGVLPDFIDGHQHVHALPQVRAALVDAIAGIDWPRRPLVRVPSGGRALDPRQRLKRLAVSAFASGLRRRLRRAAIPCNDTFSGFSAFEVGSDYAAELDAALADGDGRCHLVMCHPGHVDAALRASSDPLVERRAEELAGILALEGLAERIWHPVRTADGSIDWAGAIKP